MKKYMTVAALLAAGAAFANAATATWDFTKSAFVLDGEEVFASGDFTLSFTFDETDLGASSDLELFKIADGDTSFAFNTSSYETAGSDQYKIGLSLSNFNSITGGPWNSGGHFSTSRMNSATEGAKNTLAFSFTEKDSRIYISGDYTFSNGDKGADTDGWYFSNRSLSQKVVWNTLTVASGVSNMSVTLTADTLTAIPEPSAFGLLAGLGALALVGARRRRR